MTAATATNVTRSHRMTAAQLVDMLLSPERGPSVDVDNRRLVAAIREATRRYARHMRAGEFQAAVRAVDVLKELCEWADGDAWEGIPDE